MRSRKSQIEDEKSRRSGFGGLCGGDPAVGLSVVRLFRHVGGGEFRFRECLRVEHEARRRAVAFLRELKLFDGERPDGEDVAVHAVARGRRRPAVFRLRSVIAPSASRSSGEAPSGSERRAAGRFKTHQCHHPEPVGASGSQQVTAKLRVPSGGSRQESSGERLPPA